MPRGSKAIDATTGHRTKAEKEQRAAAEAAALTGKPLFVRPTVKEDAVAYKEFKRLKALLKSIGKDDSLFGAAVNRYCELFSEIEVHKDNRRRFFEILDSLEEEWDKLRNNDEVTKEETAKFLRQLSTTVAKVASIDSTIQSKRKMMSDIEKENGWTVMSALRAIPKTVEKKEEDELLKALCLGD